MAKEDETITSRCKKLLDLIPEVKPKEASGMLNITYSHSFRNTFYYAKNKWRDAKTKDLTESQSPVIGQLEVKSPLSIPPENNLDDSVDPPITLKNIDTIAEMTKTIQEIKDPVKRAENIARLHQMKLKPIPDNSEKTLEELFNAVSD